MSEWAIFCLMAGWPNISSNCRCQGVVTRKALRQPGTYQEGATSERRLIERHHCSWALRSPDLAGTTRSASQNRAFHEPIEVAEITLTLERASRSARNS